MNAPMHVRLSEALQSQYNLYSAYVDYQHEPFMRFRFRLERQVGYYLSNLVLPMFLIVAICFASFAVPREDIADRLSVSVTMFLAAVAYQYVVGSMLPTTSTVSILSAYVMSSFMAIGLIVVDNAFAGLLSEDLGWLCDVVFASVLGISWTGINMLLMFAGIDCCGILSLRQSWEDVAANDDLTDAWGHIEDPDSVHKSGRWVLCDKQHITKTSNSPYEQEPLLKSVKVEKVDVAEVRGEARGASEASSSSASKKKKKESEMDDVELLDRETMAV